MSIYSLELIEQLQLEGHPIAPGTAGENVTVRGVDWREVVPGRRLSLGEAEIEVTSFALPCTTIEARFSTRISRASRPSCIQAGAACTRECSAKASSAAATRCGCWTPTSAARSDATGSRRAQAVSEPDCPDESGITFEVASETSLSSTSRPPQRRQAAARISTRRFPTRPPVRMRWPPAAHTLIVEELARGRRRQTRNSRRRNRRRRPERRPWRTPIEEDSEATPGRRRRSAGRRRARRPPR